MMFGEMICFELRVPVSQTLPVGNVPTAAKAVTFLSGAVEIERREDARQNHTISHEPKRWGVKIFWSVRFTKFCPLANLWA